MNTFTPDDLANIIIDRRCLQIIRIDLATFLTDDEGEEDNRRREEMVNAIDALLKRSQ